MLLCFVVVGGGVVAVDCCSLYIGVKLCVYCCVVFLVFFMCFLI